MNPRSAQAVDDISYAPQVQKNRMPYADKTNCTLEGDLGVRSSGPKKTGASQATLRQWAASKIMQNEVEKQELVVGQGGRPEVKLKGAHFAKQNASRVEPEVEKLHDKQKAHEVESEVKK